ncbi:MAG: tetratricopeptide (TPR) repeat protein [Candidatus Saccharimonadales bacterium]|jgi:tetratricopeptide (TPR) repeat protein
MSSLVLILIFGAIAILTGKQRDTELSPIPRNLSDRLSKLWEVAHQGMKENRLLRAEKALLTILNIDEKNAAAYNRLGILYAKQKEFKDAIDCFEIASSIEPSASSLHNLGLIYYETENYEKAGTAFEQAIKLEDGLAARHIAFAKVHEKLSNQALVIDSLEKAVELEPTKESLNLLLHAYATQGLETEAKAIHKRLDRLETATQPAKKKVARPRRVVV